MPEEYNGYAAFSAGLDVKPWIYPAKKFEDEDIEIKISHCGICGSDIHVNFHLKTITGEWGYKFEQPIVVGHEIVGTVSRIGSKVDATRYKIGSRVGVGAQCGSCHSCSQCEQGVEQTCFKGTFTYNSKTADGYVTQGGYSDYYRCDAKFAVPIPDGLESDVAAPMLCAGITVYNPLKTHGAGPDKKVGVLGIGGLGHFAIMFAKAMGAEVTALSSSEAKRDDAINILGAHHYLNYNDETAFKTHTDLFDIVICTAFGSTMDWKKVLSKMQVGGKFVVVGVPQAPISFPSSSIVHRQVAVVGSLIGPPAMIEEMLNFAAKHNIKSVIEKMPMSSADEAVKKMRNTGARFRIVLENAKILSCAAAAAMTSSSSPPPPPPSFKMLFIRDIIVGDGGVQVPLPGLTMAACRVRVFGKVIQVLQVVVDKLQQQRQQLQVVINDGTASIPVLLPSPSSTSSSSSSSTISASEAVAEAVAAVGMGDWIDCFGLVSSPQLVIQCLGFSIQHDPLFAQLRTLETRHVYETVYCTTTASSQSNPSRTLPSPPAAWISTFAKFTSYNSSSFLNLVPIQTVGLPNQGEFVFAPTPPCFITQNNSENVPVNTTTNGFDGFSGFSDDAMDKDYDDDDDDEDDFAGIDLSAYDIIDDVNANVLPPLPLPPPPISTATTTATTANLETEILVFLETHGGKSTAEIKQALIQYSSPDQTTITTAAMIETTISNMASNIVIYENKGLWFVL